MSRCLFHLDCFFVLVIAAFDFRYKETDTDVERCF